jgi:hypothetical protein
MIQATRHNYNELISTINIGFKMGEGGNAKKKTRNKKTKTINTYMIP